MKSAPENKFEIIRMPPENTNSMLVCHGDECVIFDAWGRAEDWIRLIDARGLKLRAIYSTHGHPDHISAAHDLSQKYNVPWYLNRADWDLLGWGGELLDFFGMARISSDARPTDITPGVYQVLPGMKMHAISTPGHSAGAMTFWFPDFQILLTGDTLFRDSVGRCDFPGGDADALRQSISQIYNMNLDDAVYVVSGHGLDSTIGILKTENKWFC